MLKIKKSNVTIIILLVIAIVTLFLLLLVWDFHKKNNEYSSQMVINEARAHFNNMVISRSWNASHGGVYVLKNDNIEPNPYLKNNHMFGSNKEMLIKINPAWMTRQISEIANAKSKYYYKITSLKPLNPNNIADRFEAKALKLFEKNKSIKEYYEFDKESKKFNFMGVLLVAKPCLKCHADQGYKEGDIRGGIRVSMPIDAMYKNFEANKTETYLLYLSIILIATVAATMLVTFAFMVFKKQEELETVNISLEKRVEEEVEKNKKLFQDSKLNSMVELVTNLAHQWRQPLSTISTAASGMKIEKEYGILDDEKFIEQTDVILNTTNKLSTTLKDFEEIFETSEVSEDILVLNVFENALELLESRIKESKINVSLDINDSLIIKTIKKYFMEIIINIINNSIDALEKIERGKGRIDIKAYLKGDNIVITILDNGGGIPEDLMDKIYEPFFTTKHKAHGVGNSLYMTKEILENSLNSKIDILNHTYKIDDLDFKGVKCTITMPIKER